jgi:hypothetical protein
LRIPFLSQQKEQESRKEERTQLLLIIDSIAGRNPSSTEACKFGKEEKCQGTLRCRVGRRGSGRRTGPKTFPEKGSDHAKGFACIVLADEKRAGELSSKIPSPLHQKNNFLFFWTIYFQY